MSGLGISFDRPKSSDTRLNIGVFIKMQRCLEWLANCDYSTDFLVTRGAILGVALKKSSSSLTGNFICTLSGTNTMTVTGGYWIIDGVGELLVSGTTLTLGGETAYVYVSKTIVGWTCEINFQATRPDHLNGVYHYRILCKCVATNGIYSVTERGWEGGDIYQGTPLPSAR